MSTIECNICIETKIGDSMAHIGIEVTFKNGTLSTTVTGIGSPTEIHVKSGPGKQVISLASDNEDTSQTQQRATESNQQTEITARVAENLPTNPLENSLTLDGETSFETGSNFSSAETELAIAVSTLSNQAETYEYMQNEPQASLEQVDVLQREQVDVVVPSVSDESEWMLQNFGYVRRSCRARNPPPSFNAASPSFMKMRSKCTRKEKMVRSRKC
ncbi:hypothetical protein DdX_06472 [Ditylenchus destructor]|uniref:Uncharacterized protein n=1 Tax=Ditylenchus destructor TaxID=166010 RepID=A0AAD4N5Z5_9BILA|nr:hypothetical protein DdX_06472 [Ditylenchus destructor]